jgi:hypothetical protein
MLLVIGKSALELHSKVHATPPPPSDAAIKSLLCAFGYTTVSFHLGHKRFSLNFFTNLTFEQFA